MIRLWDPAVDAPGELADVWNDHYGTVLFGLQHFERLNPANTIVAQEPEGLVACAFLMDGGGPFALLSEIVMRHRQGRHRLMRDVIQFAEGICHDRGIAWFNGILEMDGSAAESFLRLMRRHAWDAQYLGERPMYCRRLS